jgi:hypothetical protein
MDGPNLRGFFKHIHRAKNIALYRRFGYYFLQSATSGELGG